MPFNRFEFKQLPVSLWRNGGGETREIVSLPLGNADFDWRASIATIAQAGPFSAFSGIDRSITLLEGDGVHLYSAGQVDHRLTTIGEPFAFSGDLEVQAQLPGGSSQDFNIMTRRGRQSADVQAVVAATPLPTGHAGVIYVLRGDWQLRQPQSLTLHPRQGGWWSAMDHASQLVPLTPNALALWADIRSHHPSGG